MNVYREIYNRKYLNYSNQSGVVFPDLLGRFTSRVRERNVLDLGCGTGHDCDYFFSKGFDVVGVDISDKMIGFCKKKYGDKIKFVVDDILRKNFFDNYEFRNVWVSAVIMHFNDKERAGFLGALHDYIDDDGIVGMIVPCKKMGDKRSGIWKKMGAEFHTFDKNDLMKMLVKNAFEIIDYVSFDFRDFPWTFVIFKRKMRNLC